MQLCDLLIEIGTEELPAKTLQTLINAFSTNLQTALAKNGLAHGSVREFATPRRLAVIINELVSLQESRMVERKGPALASAFDANHQPTKACLGFAQSCGVSVDQLEIRKTEKGEWLYFQQEQPSIITAHLLPQIIRDVLMKLPIAKPMHWGNHDVAFVRPVHWVVLLLGEECIDAEILGIRSGRETYGHRFHHPQKINISHPCEYEQRLRETGKVIANYDERKKYILECIDAIVKQKLHTHEVVWRNDPELLDEVTGLVEWPVAFLGQFETKFLEIPPQVIITVMRNHQRYFALFDQQKLLPYFVAVSNIESKNPERVIEGNERVIRARLADAQFFYHSDSKHSLQSRLEELKTVIFQRKLGTLFDKAQRISKLACEIAKKINANEKLAARAGLLCKTDLMTAMVGEFPELQGVMGYYYAKEDGEEESLAIALRDHYLPRFSGDDLPKSDMGCAVSIADKLDTILGIFAIAQPPTGEKDPFGLRRAALGILRICIEKELPLDLRELLNIAYQNYAIDFENKQAIENALDFILERLRSWYLEGGIKPDVFASVLARYPTQPLDFHQRLIAVQHFQTLPEAFALTSANKRVSNILKKQDGGRIAHHPVNPDLLEHIAEKELDTLLEQKNKEVELLCHKTQYAEALSCLALLQKAVDHFFDEVLVMSEDEKIRNNRLALLNNLRNLFLQVADISLLQI